MPQLLNAAPTSETDSLLALLPHAKDEHRLEILNRLAFVYRVIDPEKTIQYASEALEQAKIAANLKYQQEAMSNLGLGYRYLGEYNTSLSYQQEALTLALIMENDELAAQEYNRLGVIYKQWGLYTDALMYYLKALSIREKLGDKIGIANLYNNIGNVYRNRGDLDLALDYFLKTQDLREQLGDKEGYSYILNNTGNVYSDLKNYPKALEAHMKSLKVKQELGDKIGMSTSLSNIGDIYLKLGEVEQGMEYFQKSLNLAKEIGYKSGIAGTFNSLGDAYVAVNNYSKALEYHSMALQLLEELGDKHGIINTYIKFSNIYIQRKDYDKALRYLDKSLDFAKDENILDVIKDIYYYYSQIYSTTGRYEKALAYYQKYSQFKDSVFNSEIGEKITELQIRHISDQHIRESRILVEKNEGEMKRKNQFIYFLIAITILIFFLVVVILNRNRINRIANRALELKNKNISEQNHFLQAMMDTIPNPMYYKNAQGRYLGCNTAFEKIHQKQKHDIIGKSDPDLYPPSLVNLFEKKDAELIAHPGIQQFESRISLPNEDIWEAIFYKNTFYNADGSVSGILGIILNITERKKAELRMQQSEKELLEANATKDKFFSIIAHDLSNPFSAILGFSRLLLDEYQYYNEKEIRAMIENIFKATESSSRLLQNLLEWSRSQSNRFEMHCETIDLSILVNENIKFFNSMARVKKIKLSSSVAYNTLVYADRNMINTVLRNLISNSIKFTGQGGKVAVSAYPSNGFVEVCVEDSGTGISPEDLPRLFRIDEQVRQKGTANESGTGLGLILCREFVEKNGGIIRVESQLNQGSRFFFSLPVNPIKP
ncbi:MAG: tetratricopeptide repeat protein [Bacteroidales bacterium]|nr:tetratricopeptide repeat protein [Bacteroidales bacterium]